MRKLLAVTTAVALLAGASAAWAAHADDRRAAGAVVAPELSDAVAGADPDEPIVVFVHGDDMASARAAAAASGLATVGEWTSIDVVVASGTPSQVAAVAGQPGVTYVEPNTPVTFFLDTARAATRADEAVEREWSTETASNGPQASRPGCEQGSAPHPKPGCEDEGRRFDGSGQTIAIVDGGVDGTHPMFALPDGTSKVVRNMRVTCPGTSFFIVGGADTPEDQCLHDEAAPVQVVDMPGNDTDTMTAGGHGTHVAGIAGGVEVDALGTRFSGVAPGAKMVSFGTGAAIGILGANTALDWIVRNHDRPCGDGVPAEACPPITVVNNSYGPQGGGSFRPASATVKLQRELVERGIVMVWANGNDGGDGTANQSNPPGQDPTPGILSVANYDDADEGTRDGSLAPSSSRGDPNDVTTFPDLSAPGTSITSACRARLPICSSGEEDPDYGTITGTSMAAPHVAGAVAVLQQALRESGEDTSPAAVEDLLEDTAYEFSFVGPYVPDHPDRNADGLTSFDKGHGLLDLTAAISAGIGATDEPPTTTAPCEPGAPVLTDGLGDGSFLVAPNDPALDVVAASLSADAAARTVTLTIEVDDLPATPSARGERWITDFWVGARAHQLDVQRLPGDPGPHLRSVDGNGEGTVTFDPEADTITYVVGADAFVPRLAGEVVVDGFTVASLNATPVVVGFFADDAAARCPGALDTGTPPPLPDPEPGTGDGRVTPGGEAHVWRATPPVPVNGGPDAALICTGPTDPRCDHHVLEVALQGATQSTLRVEVRTMAEGDDFDVFLWGPDGALVGDAATGENPEVIEVPVTAPGLYTVSVAAWLTLGDPYHGTAALG